MEPDIELSIKERYQLHYSFNMILLESWTIDELRYMAHTVNNMEEE